MEAKKLAARPLSVRKILESLGLKAQEVEKVMKTGGGQGKVRD